MTGWRGCWPWLVVAGSLGCVILAVSLTFTPARTQGQRPGESPTSPSETGGATTVVSRVAPTMMTRPDGRSTASADCRAAVDSLVIWVLNDGTPPGKVPVACSSLSPVEYRVVWDEELADVTRLSH